MPKFMVRVLRSSDDDYADVVVEANTAEYAGTVALQMVRADPGQWFDEPSKPIYYLDPASEIEDVEGTEYA